MNQEELIKQIKNDPKSVEFIYVMEVIDQNYQYTPTQFTNGNVINEGGTNEGSCKIFSFGKINDLNEQETLSCFGSYYREDVLKNPEGSDHANIRTFMQSGWAGIKFDSPALS